MEHKIKLLVRDSSIHALLVFGESSVMSRKGGLASFEGSVGAPTGILFRVIIWGLGITC